MASMSGSLKDFGLAPILQLIGHQQKTGVLTLKKENDEIRIVFENGMIIGSEHPTREGKGYLGEMLVRSGFISRNQLNSALNIQKETLQRLGDILINSQLITRIELIEILNLQTRETLHSLFRWQDGSYSFEVVKVKSQDKGLERISPDPINPEHILMEGLQMVDEWPDIQKSIHSTDMIFKQAGSISSLPHEVEKEFSHEHKFVFELVNGKRTVKNIIDLSRLGEFDSSRLLKDLLDWNLIEETALAKISKAPGYKDTRGDLLHYVNQGLIVSAIFLSIIVIILFFEINPFDFFTLGDNSRKSIQFSKLAIQELRAWEIHDALEIYFLENNKYPEDINELVKAHLILPEYADYLNRYEYELKPEGYDLKSSD